MSSEWRLAPIGTLAQLFDGPHATPKKTADGPVFLGISCLRNGRLDLSNTEHLSDSDYSKWTRRVVPQADDVVFSYETRIGQAAIIPSGLNCCLGRRMALLRPDPTRLLPKYLLYYFLSDEFQELLRARTIHGSTVERLPLSDFPSYPVRVPPLGIQRGIIEVLEALDDRIALLRETNATLEAIAQALFKSWFVDFDPVRAKAEGRSPDGMSDATAALFPDGFEESELGLVPRRWAVSTIGEAVTTVGGATPDTKNDRFWHPAEHCWTSPKDLSGSTSPVMLDTERRVSSEGLARIGSGLLPRGTLLMSSRAPIGYLALTAVPVAINQGYIAIPPGSRLAPLYMYFWCKHNMGTIKDHANGSTFMEISKKAFRPIELIVPSDDVAQEFLQLAEPLFDRIEQNERQAQTLAALRDTLLPRLISGQLRLAEAEAKSVEVPA